MGKDSKDKGYGMDAPTYNGYKNKDYKEYRSDPYARYYKTEYGLDSKDSEYEMRSILNGYKNKDYKKNDGDDKKDKNGKDLYEKEYFNDPYKREYRTDPYARTYRTDPYARTYRNDPYAREYRAPCCAGQELSGGLCYPICASGFSGAGPVCWDGPVFFFQFIWSRSWEISIFILLINNEKIN